MVLLSVFIRQKAIANENVSFIDHAPLIRLLDGCKLAINQKKNNDVTICQHDVIVKFFWRCCVSFNKFSYWTKFYVNIMTGSGVTIIFVYKGLTRNPEIGTTPVWILPNIWRLGQVRDTKFCTNFYNKMLLNAAKCQGYSFYRFWVIKGKLIGGKITRSPPHTDLV